MKTFAQMHDDCNANGQPCSYWGDYADWLCVAGRSRDSDLLEESNFTVARERLETIDSDGIAVESENHWAVGWVETLLVDPNKPDLVAEAEWIRSAIEDYPILDESDYLDRQVEAAQENLIDCLQWNGNALDELMGRFGFDDGLEAASNLPIMQWLSDGGYDEDSDGNGYYPDWQHIVDSVENCLPGHLADERVRKLESAGQLRLIA